MICSFICIQIRSLGLKDGGLDRARQILQILFVYSSHRYSSVRYHIDMKPVDQHPALQWRQSCEGEHADLVGNMVPRSRCPDSLQLLSQILPGLNNSECHNVSQFCSPGLRKLLAIEDLLSNVSSVARGTHVSFSDQRSALTNTIQ